MATPQPESGRGTSFRDFVREYGGVRAIACSPFLWASVVLTAACWSRWSAAGWWEDPTGVLPDLLGFSLGAYTILLSLGSERFRILLHRRKAADAVSLYEELNATFAYFVLVQSVALVLAVLAGAVMPERKDDQVNDLALGWALVSGVGYLAFVYALSLCAASTWLLFRIGRQVQSVAGTDAEQQARRAFVDEMESELEARTQETDVTDDELSALGAVVAVARNVDVGWFNLFRNIRRLREQAEIGSPRRTALDAALLAHDQVTQAFLGYGSIAHEMKSDQARRAKSKPSSGS